MWVLLTPLAAVAMLAAGPLTRGLSPRAQLAAPLLVAALWGLAAGIHGLRTLRRYRALQDAQRARTAECLRTLRT